MLNPEERVLVSDSIRFILEPPLLDEINFQGELKEVDSGEIIMRAGDPMKFIPILISGALRVMRRDDEGKEILLYYLEQGETCAISLKCCTTRALSKVSVIAEEKSCILMIPLKCMNDWLVKYETWRNFVLTSFDERLNEMIATIDALAFSDLEQRLKGYLMNRVWIKHNKTLKTSHQDIANDLNSSREVISRLLKKMEQDGVLKQGRKEITMLNKIEL